MDTHEFHRDDEARARPPREATPKAAQPIVGNAALQRVLPSLPTSSPAVLDEAVARAIHAKRGSGNRLDDRAQQDIGESMGHDFSDVNVHTDAEADRLNRAVRAEAFTTGRDIFFREGRYDPASNEGRKLLAHELTHVVQQRNAPPKQELTVSDPGDASERQASDVANAVTAASSAPASSVARQEAPPEEEEETAARQEAPAEEEEETAARKEAPAEEEEEQVATSRADRQEAAEEEEEPAT
jgi:hypothetical protein